jgi:hypothetical protein
MVRHRKKTNKTKVKPALAATNDETVKNDSAEAERRTKTNKTKVKPAVAATNDETIKNDSAEAERQKGSEEDKALWDVFNSHPMVVSAKIVLLPYVLYLAYYFFRLQHPEFLRLRPAVLVSDPRQLLIVAAPFSGNIPITRALYKTLELEIGHETSDTTWHFARDGTVSWFHGIRFLNDPIAPPTKSLVEICKKGEMSFHPSNYKYPSDGNCSSRSSWDQCWQLECIQTVYREWGCSTGNTAASCETPFQYKLHQVRNPMRTLEALTVEYCPEGLDGPAKDSFLTYASAIFPNLDFADYSCLETAGYFLVEYQNAMIRARKRGDIDAFYRIEDSSPCDVARLAGLLELSTTIYPPHFRQIQGLCATDDESITSLPKPAVEAQTTVKQKEAAKTLGWKDLRGAMHGSKRKPNNKDLEHKFREMFHAFGYDEAEESEEIVEGSEFDS